MPTIKFRPHAVVTYYNGGGEAVAVDFTPTLSFDLDEVEREADRRGATYFVVQVFGATLTVRSEFVYKFDEDLRCYRLVLVMIFTGLRGMTYPMDVMPPRISRQLQRVQIIPLRITGMAAILSR